MSEFPSARCLAAVGIDWHLAGIQVVTRRRPAVSMPIGSLSGRRRLCSHSSGNLTSVRCQYAHWVTVGPTPALLATRPWSAVGPRIGSRSDQCWNCSAYARHLLGKPTSARYLDIIADYFLTVLILQISKDQMLHKIKDMKICVSFCAQYSFKSLCTLHVL